MLMPFIHGASQGIDNDADKIDWITSRCSAIGILFDRIVTDESMIHVLNKELFWKNIDTCLILLLAFKR